MSKENPLVFSKSHILEYLTNQRHINQVSEIAQLFLDRFEPSAPLSDTKLQERLSNLRTTIQNDVEDSVAETLLLKMLDIIKHTLKTNIYMENRYSLSLRLDSEIMFHESDNREHPFGVIFVHGRRFNGYHVRFRDIARGGLRLVTPSSLEQFSLESARQFDECYGLAYAQQQKNKGK